MSVHNCSEHRDDAATDEDMQNGRLDILVADDHRLTRDIVSEVLKTIDCRRVRFVEDGARAVSEIVASPPDIAIIDFDMPSDGLSVLQFVRRSPACPDPTMPVIVMTSLTAPQRVVTLRDAGVNEVITKPFSAQIVLAKLAAVIDRPRRFIRSTNYVGPCRRRRATANYAGPLRRETDHALLLG